MNRRCGLVHEILVSNSSMRGDVVLIAREKFFKRGHCQLGCIGACEQLRVEMCGGHQAVELEGSARRREISGKVPLVLANLESTSQRGEPVSLGGSDKFTDRARAIVGIVGRALPTGLPAKGEARRGRTG